MEISLEADFSQLQDLISKVVALQLQFNSQEESFPPDEMLSLLRDAAERGEMIMLLSLMSSVGKKSTGQTARNMFHEALQTPRGYKLGIGVNQPGGLYASNPRFALMDTAPTMINRSVMVNKNTGKWRFIKLRPAIPAHTYLTDGGKAMEKDLLKYLEIWFEEKVAQLSKSLENRMSGAIKNE